MADSPLGTQQSWKELMEKDNLFFRIYVTSGHRSFKILCRDRLVSNQLWESRMVDGDVQIETKDNKLLTANKVILSLNPVFSEEMNLTALNGSFIRLTDYDSADVESLLFYMYTGQLLTHAASFPLLHLANKFQQPNLVALCTDAMTANTRCMFGDEFLEFAGEFIHHNSSITQPILAPKYVYM